VEEEEKKGGEQDEDSGDDDEEEKDPAKKKKKKRNKKKKKTGEGGATTGPGGVQYVPRAQDNSHIRKLGDWQAEGKSPFKQTYPPTIPIGQQFPNGKFPEGEICEYSRDENRKRITAAEYREKERLFT
jgi:methionyl aminopeptidase